MVRGAWPFDRANATVDAGCLARAVACAGGGLLGLVAYDGQWQRPEQVSKSIHENKDLANRAEEYQKKRVKTPDRAEDQWKLALWCEQNDLKQQATAHLYRVLMLDPSRDAAWKRLGFKKSAGRWSKPEQLAAAKAEALAQHKANAHWKATLEKLAEALSSKDKHRRAEAEKSLAEITDPRAVPMIWMVFARGGEPRQKVAVRLLSQIDSPGSSRAIALLAVMSPSAFVRGDATASLRRARPTRFRSGIDRHARRQDQVPGAAGLRSWLSGRACDRKPPGERQSHLFAAAAADCESAARRLRHVRLLRPPGPRSHRDRGWRPGKVQPEYTRSSPGDVRVEQCVAIDQCAQSSGFAAGA